MAVSGTFIEGGAGRVLVVHHRPERPSNRAVLVVPAFAEEMNKSRRLVRDVAAALCQRGIWTLVPDLFGTGDSEGEFVEARWDVWVEDLCRTVAWARLEGATRFSVLVVRFGVALFAAAAPRMGISFEKGIAWDPVTSGGDVLRQLVRMKIMAIRMAGGRTEPADAMLRSLLQGPDAVEFGGYMISPALASAVHGVGPGGRIGGEVGEGLTLLFEGATAADPRRSVGPWPVRAVKAEKFWAVVEPRANNELVRVTTDFLDAAA